MRLLGLAGLLASLALPALVLPARADDVTRSGSGDIDGDGVPDRVDLKRSADDISVDVAITLSRSKRTVRVQALVGAEDADPPAFDKGEVTLVFAWLDGRYKTHTRFYIGMEGPELVVRRYETAVVDSISANPDGTVKAEFCAADFTANRATRNDKPADPPGKPVPLANWKDDSVPKACQF
jgi:hypothetical protein